MGTIRKTVRGVCLCTYTHVCLHACVYVYMCVYLPVCAPTPPVPVCPFLARLPPQVPHHLLDMVGGH